MSYQNERQTKNYIFRQRRAFVSNVIQTYFADEGIRHLTTLGHAPVAERQIRTMKGMIYKRIEHTNQNWWD